MLLEIAKGDAYGVGFEFVTSDIIKEEHRLEKYYGSRIDDLVAGQYSDDTQMTLAIAEMMLSKQEWTRLNITRFFLNAFKRDQRCGYANGFYQFLTMTDTAEEFLENIHPESIRNGAAMRSVPLGLFSTIDEVKNKCEIQARITHDTHEGIVSSQAVGLMTYFFKNKIGKKDELKYFIEKNTEELFKDDKTTRTACDAIDTIDAVLTVLKNSKSLSEVIDLSILLGGDTDSVASIACGVASFSDEFKKDLPLFLETELENGKYGKDYIIYLDEQMKKCFL